MTVNFIAEDNAGHVWFFNVSGALTTHRGGLLRTDTVWKSLSRAYALKRTLDDGKIPLVFLTSHLPRRPSEGITALREAGPSAFFDAIEMLDIGGIERLRLYAKGDSTNSPEPGFWTSAELDRRTT